MGRLLFVDLSTGEIREEIPEEGLYRDFIGGYGISSRILYSRQKAEVDPQQVARVERWGSDDEGVPDALAAKIRSKDDQPADDPAR